MNKERLILLYNAHKGGLNGAGIGLLLAITFLSLGFFRTLFIAICVGIGYYIGKRISEDKEYIKKLLDRILPPGSYR